MDQEQEITKEQLESFIAKKVSAALNEKDFYESGRLADSGGRFLDLFFC